MLKLIQGGGQGNGVTGQTCAILVRVILAGTANGHLNHLRSNRGQQSNHERREGVGPVIVAVRAAEHRTKRKHLGDYADDGGDTRRHGGGQNIAVVHVHELVAEHAAHLTLVQQLQDALSAAHGRVLRITASRERVRGHRGGHVEAGHRLAGGA